MLVMKEIRPSKLNVAGMRLALLNAMRKAGRQITKDFKSTTATWDHQPKWEQMISLTGPGPVLLVGTDDQIYRWVDEGTGLWGPKHAKYPIPKDKPGWLSFPGVYVAKTAPGVIGSRAGGSGGEKVTLFGQIMHPGIESRHFDKLIQKKWEPLFKRLMEEAMKEAAKKSGHGV